MTSGRFIIAVTGLAGLTTLAAGIWALLAPGSFAEFVNFPAHEHFLHDLGAFQIGLGVLLLLALIWADALSTVLSGFFVANTLHTVNHVIDLDLGGYAWQPWALGVLSLALAAALVLRVRRLGYVVGAVTLATVTQLAGFVRQKTVSLTTYRKDGRTGSTPVSIAVDGDRAYIRSFEKSIKTRRLQREPKIEVAACTARGKPTGAPIPGRMRRLHGEEYRHAARMLRRKHPMLHGVLVPMAHRIGRTKTGRTVHFELEIR
ncbi:MAG: PPOX class F420-dependent oxidoreductase [Haloechinothrix sp.]